MSSEKESAVSPSTATKSNNENIIDEHLKSIQEVANMYGTSVNESDVSHSQGLTEAQAMAALEKYGRNILTPAAKESPLLVFLRHLCGLFNVMLIVAGILSFVVYVIDDSHDSMNLILGSVLLAVTFINAGIEFFQEFKSSQMLESFMNLLPANTIVIRDGKAKEISAMDLVPGDIVALKNGEKIPADIRLIACSEMKVDNSSLTGESEPLERSLSKGNNRFMESSNLIFYGTLIVGGEGYGIVIRTGDRTVLGSIASSTINEEKRESQLSGEINLFVRKMAVVAVVTAIIFFIIGITAVNKGDWGKNFSFAIGVLVAFVPQGLPLTVTMLLTIAAKRLATMNVLVKDLQGVETLGSITLLASDKTGTLTQNKMTVMNAWVNLEQHTVQEIDQETSRTAGGEAIPNIQLLTQISCLCTKARFDSEDQAPIETRRVFGDATETGLLRYAAMHGDVDAVSREYPKMFEVPFNSSTKWHMTFHNIRHENGEITVYLKGAPERVVKMCSKVLVKDQVLEWDNSHTQAFDKAYESFAQQGQRVLAFAMIKLNAKDYPLDFKFIRDPANFPLDGFTFVGMFSLMDPPKRGVRKAVAACRTAGIQVVMVTGDHPLTAEAIARKIGLIHGETASEVALRLRKPVQMVTEEEYDAVVIHGDKIDNMSDTEWDRVLSKKEIVFARTAPHHKLMIVNRCQAKGHIVGVSGDGVNDSPALKKADLGISMNLTGSDVSKEAAAMILLDDNFASIVVGINQGRLIFSNLKKSIRYTLTHILPEAMAFLIFICAGIPLPLSSILILLIDLGTELLPAISFAWEIPDENIMLVPPRKVLCTAERNYASFDVERSGSFARTVSNASSANRSANRSFTQKAVSYFRYMFARNETGEILVDNDLLIWSYLQSGLFVTIGCFAAYGISLYLDVSEKTGFGWKDVAKLDKEKDEKKKTELEDILYRAQAAYFIALVIGQWFTLILCKKQFDLPNMDTFKNWRSFAAIIFGAIFSVIIIYVPGIQNIGTRNVYWQSWLIAIGVGIVFMIYDCVRKVLRRKGYFGGVPKKNDNLLELVRTTSTC